MRLAKSGSHDAPRYRFAQRGAALAAVLLLTWAGAAGARAGEENDAEPAAAAVREDVVTGTVLVNGGAERAFSRSVTLNLSAISTAADLYRMRLSADGETWGSWEVYSTTRAYVLTAGNGQKTVWARFADRQWNMSVAVSTTVTLDAPPVLLPLPRQMTVLPTLSVPYSGRADLDLTGYVDDPAYLRAVIKTSVGDIPARLLEWQAPMTVANFMRYAEAGRYKDNVVHRAVKDFVVQTGGFTLSTTGVFVSVPTYKPVRNEFGVSSTRATLAMAKFGGLPHSATGQWFVNLADNSANLDFQNGGFTVFGEVLDMTTVDAIAALRTVNMGGSMTNLPVRVAEGSSIHPDDLVYVRSVTEQPDELTFTVSGTVTGVTATIADGVLSVVPAGDPIITSGALTVRACAADGRQLDMPVTVQVTTNRAPLLENGNASKAVTCDEDTVAKVTLAASDQDRDALTWQITSQGTTGTAAMLTPASEAATTRAFTYTPRANAHGTDRFIVRVSDGKGGTDTIQVNVTIRSVEDAPVLTGLANTTVRAGEVGTVVFTVADVDSAATDVQITVAASDRRAFPAGSVTTTGTGADRSLRLAPAYSTAASTATITLTATDGHVRATYRVVVTVTAGRVPQSLSLEPAVLQMLPGTNHTFELKALYGDRETLTVDPSAFRLTANPATRTTIRGGTLTLAAAMPAGTMIRLTATFAGQTATAVVYVVSEVAAVGHYLLIDLSAGPEATTYPSQVLDAPPVGGWTDTHRTDLLVLRYIPAGTAHLGSPANETGRGADETALTATLSQPLYVGLFEVTQHQWEQVMGDQPATFAGTDIRPVESVSWTTVRGGTWPGGTPAADSFLGRLAQRAGLDADLPTEAQWEYTCRAGCAAALYSGKGVGTAAADANLALLGHHAGAAGSGPYAVGGLLPNGWGLLDSLGNVAEWCLDWYGPYPAGPVADYTGPEPGATGGRVVRGGAWDATAAACRCASRAWRPADATGAGSTVGFRVVIGTTDL